MSIDLQTVDAIANLARIAIEDDHKAELAQELSNILDLFDQLQQADVDDLEPLAHPLELTQRLRDDVVTETDRHDIYQAIAPKVEAGLYLVPQVIE